MRRSVKVGAVVILIVLFVVPAVIADYQDGFDSYIAPASGFGPWTVTRSDPTCWLSPGVANVGSYARTPPNTVAWVISPSCYGTYQTANLSATFTATEPTIAISSTSDRTPSPSPHSIRSISVGL